jgi:hypothetical protein
MDTDIVEFFDEHANVASVSELATLLDESEGRIRAWAREHPDDVRRIGSTFCFTPESAELMLTDFESEEGLDDEDFDSNDSSDSEDEEE